MFWDNPETRIISASYYCIFTYVIVLVVVTFCYGKILIVVRRQAGVLASHNAAGPSAAHAQSNKVQFSLIKTMMLICAFYAVAWLPEKLYTFTYVGYLNMPLPSSGYHVITSFAFLYICAANLNDRQRQRLGALSAEFAQAEILGLIA